MITLPSLGAINPNISTDDRDHISLINGPPICLYMKRVLAALVTIVA